jgi:endoglucanase
MATGLVSIPTRYLHTASEVLSADDVDAAVALLIRFVLDLPETLDVTP